MSLWDQISNDISTTTKLPFRIEEQRSISGGCINSAYLISDGQRRYFIKTNKASMLSMFEAEYAGLSEIEKTQTIRVPKPLCVGQNNKTAYLVLEYLELGGANARSSDALGQHLAAMHKVTTSEFGWYRDNTIGSTPQLNETRNNWIEFWREQRLAYQFTLALQNGFSGRLQRDGEKLLAQIDCFFEGYTPEASLLHGDLWSGNYAISSDNQPVIFDPATYYGDRETDLAMTELFGGFPARFYAAYNETHPLDSGYSVRKTLYNLYHILNHLNLFGGGYLSQAEGMIGSLLSDIS